MYAGYGSAGYSNVGTVSAPGNRLHVETYRRFSDVRRQTYADNFGRTMRGSEDKDELGTCEGVMRRKTKLPCGDKCGRTCGSFVTTSVERLTKSCGQKTM